MYNYQRLCKPKGLSYSDSPSRKIKLTGYYCGARSYFSAMCRFLASRTVRLDSINRDEISTMSDGTIPLGGPPATNNGNVSDYNIALS